MSGNLIEMQALSGDSMSAAYRKLRRKMSREPSWNAIPAEILRRTFEMQQNGLANCAAARSCVAWRDAVRNSRFNNLHLHADTDEQELFWHGLLASRHSVDILKLDRAGKASTFFPMPQRSQAVADATMNSIPTACRSLTVSELAAYSLEQYIAKSPTLEQLSLRWNGLRANQKSFHHLPTLATLRYLTKLTVNLLNDSCGTSFADVVQSSPSTLQSLVLHGYVPARHPEHPPSFSVRSLGLLEQHLPILTSLELCKSVITIQGESITCLTKLRSLRLPSCDL